MTVQNFTAFATHDNKTACMVDDCPLESTGSEEVLGLGSNYSCSNSV